MKHPIPTVLAILFVLFIALSLRPIDQPTPESCDLVKGELVEIVPNTQNKDISLLLKDDDHRYYINRGLEKSGLLEALESLPGKEINVYSVRHWTPLDPFGAIRYIAHVEYQEQVFYSEFGY